MSWESKAAGSSLSTSEVFAVIGFALYIGWMLLDCFWLFIDYPAGGSATDRSIVQAFVFASIPAGFLGAHFMGKSATFDFFALPIRVFELVGAAALPLAVLASQFGLELPLAVSCVLALLMGWCASWLMLSWYDLFSRLRDCRHDTAISAGMFAGGVLFVVASLAMSFVPLVIGFGYLVLSWVLVAYLDHAVARDEWQPLNESIREAWQFTKEIEPSFFMFGIVFGLSFAYLFSVGATAVIVALVSTLAGSLIALILSCIPACRNVSVAVYQRVFVVVCMLACLVAPFVPVVGRVACSCVMVATWSLFTIMNASNVAKKCLLVPEVPLAAQAPGRLAVSASGLAVGWILAAVFATVFGAQSDAFTYLRLGVAVVLVATVMVFVPSARHHPAGGSEPVQPKEEKTVVTVDLSAHELFEKRVDAVAKLYQLTPRETEILDYLARGRNAAYIQEDLMVSSHTVKSHIYNIYRKLDIHSQQKLMDFVHDFPID